MSRESWMPLPHEADLFSEVYIDESSQTNHRFLVIGGIVCSMRHASQFESDIVAARGDDLPTIGANGESRVLKWQKVSKRKLDAYRRVVDAFFDFPKKYNLPLREHLDIHCTAIDTSRKGDSAFTSHDEYVGYNREIYFLCGVRIARLYERSLFHVYIDRRTADISPLRQIVNGALYNQSDPRTAPFRRIQWEDPEECQALQVTDILIGAIAYKLNAHYEQQDANSAKKELCDHIFKRGRIFHLSKNTKTARLTLFHNNFSKYPNLG